MSDDPKSGEVTTNSIGMRLVWIPPGEFDMGSPLSEYYGSPLPSGESRWDDECQVHQVRISQGFWMGQTQVTQGQYAKVMGSRPWSGEKGVQQSANNAASYISWEYAAAFCSKLSEMEGRSYRLPTEAEWEYACRGDSQSRFYFGDDDSQLDDYAWFEKNTRYAGEQYAHRVAQKKPNVFGLYDMHGNVWEWCQDWHDKDYYSSSPNIDPQGPATGKCRVLRGGSWCSGPWDCRSAYRLRCVPDYRAHYSDLGFRILLNSK